MKQKLPQLDYWKRYEELSDDEKSYDRNTALETLKCIIKLGYTIEKKN